MHPKFIEQFERVRRWHYRLKEIYKDNKVDKTSLKNEDEIYAFFINCYHLKDWIKNDPSSGIIPEEVEKFVENSENLKISGDLCTGSKHLQIKRPRIDKTTDITRHFYAGFNIVRFEVRVGNKSCDALDLASKCLSEWEEFIKKNSHVEFWSHIE